MIVSFLVVSFPLRHRLSVEAMYYRYSERVRLSDKSIPTAGDRAVQNYFFLVAVKQRKAYKYLNVFAPPAIV